MEKHAGGRQTPVFCLDFCCQHTSSLFISFCCFCMCFVFISQCASTSSTASVVLSMQNSRIHRIYTLRLLCFDILTTTTTTTTTTNEHVSCHAFAFDFVASFFCPMIFTLFMCCCLLTSVQNALLSFCLSCIEMNVGYCLQLVLILLPLTSSETYAKNIKFPQKHTKKIVVSLPRLGNIYVGLCLLKVGFSYNHLSSFV